LEFNIFLHIELQGPPEKYVHKKLINHSTAIRERERESSFFNFSASLAIRMLHFVLQTARDRKEKGSLRVPEKLADC
jgi:hypothetical protein